MFSSHIVLDLLRLFENFMGVDGVHCVTLSRSYEATVRVSYVLWEACWLLVVMHNEFMAYFVSCPFVIASPGEAIAEGPKEASLQVHEEMS